jgi:two-component system response regulator HydG/two-component system response regulator AtoC
MHQPKILLIDDNEAFLELFLSLPEATSFDIVPLTSAQKALDIVNKESVDLIISDVQMPEMTGTDLFNIVQDCYPGIPVILITAYGSTEQAIRAVKQGAFHYFEKPIDAQLDLFWTTVREALVKREMLKDLASLRREKSLRLKTSVPFIGQSEGIKKVIRSIKEVSGLPVTVLICGETGTGKDLVARSIHDLSQRRDKSFFAVHCNEFAPGVLESELFGHEKGAFTGAIDRKTGLFELVHEGTLFLDEISDAPPMLQSKLLRVLETKTFTRVGGTSSIYSDFRIITATNLDLEAEVARGHFRKDLFYRLNIYAIEIPPLRNRKEDIPLIAEHYLKRFSQAYRRPIGGISMKALLSLREYDWPGNVRELINVIERAVITCNEAMITTKHLPFHTEEYQNISGLNLKDMEKFFITMALKQTQNNKSKAAELLGISRKGLTDKVKVYRLDV